MAGFAGATVVGVIRRGLAALEAEEAGLGVERGDRDFEDERPRAVWRALACALDWACCALETRESAFALSRDLGFVTGRPSREECALAVSRAAAVFARIAADLTAVSIQLQAAGPDPDSSED